ncbi:hypothetical protein H9W90_02380 [Polaribacter pectinis]|uniref:Uncharacterized protein n=1 Tax=Polaribacter pectinis TaxID=2738844 RepID=A0A7G9LBI1_9FLAO|nr:hypothetical protein [Polaribacter pectinis]QNM85980.1 hypothetical protein H9W90_02380 [Polaribacter pectinis]
MDKYYPKYKQKKNNEDLNLSVHNKSLELLLYEFLFFSDFYINYINKKSSINKVEDTANVKAIIENQISSIINLFSLDLSEKDFTRFDSSGDKIKDLEIVNTMFFTTFYQDSIENHKFEVVNIETTMNTFENETLFQNVHSIITLFNSNEIVKKIFIVLHPIFGNALTVRELTEKGHNTIIISGTPNLGTFLEREVFFGELTEYCFKK